MLLDSLIDCMLKIHIAEVERRTKKKARSSFLPFGLINKKWNFQAPTGVTIEGKFILTNCIGGANYAINKQSNRSVTSYNFQYSVGVIRQKNTTYWV